PAVISEECVYCYFFFSSRRRHTRFSRDWSSDVCSSDLIEIQTRSGNTRTPDDAWSEWSAPYTNADGSQITSPNARYLQWRAVLSGKGETPVLTSVTAAYLQRNIRPEVSSITVHPRSEEHTSELQSRE